MAKVIITSARDSNLRSVEHRLSGQPFSWAYFGQSINEFKQVSAVFQERGDELDTTESFQKVAESLREPYLKYIYDIGRQMASLRWWITGVSYRSGYVSKTFHAACHMKLALEMVEDWEAPAHLVLVIPNQQTRTSLARNLDSVEFAEVTLIDGGRTRPSLPGSTLVKMLIRRSYFVWREVSRLVQSRSLALRPPVSDRPVTLLVAYATRGNMSNGANFHKPFFGDLSDYLERSGHPVAIVPMVLKDVHYGDALRDIRKGSNTLMMPHSYLSLKDIIWAAITSLTRPPQPKPIPTFCGLDIGPLIEEELRAYHATNWAADVLLMAALVRRWAKAGISVSRMIYIFENQPWERALCWAFKQHTPQTELVGYQHARTPRLLLNFHLAPNGEPLAPLPDRIVTVGKHTAQLLVEGGHDPESIRVGGALQMQDFLAHRFEDRNASVPIETQTVLIACSNGVEETSELVEIALNLFEEVDGIQVLVKCHPLMPFEQVSDLGPAEIPSHIKVTNENLADLIIKSSLMVYSGSTVCFQALALSVPVIHLNTRFDLDVDPLEAVPSLRMQATGTGELREKVKWLIKHREEYIAQNRADWDAVVADMYGPVNEETIKAFVE